MTTPSTATARQTDQVLHGALTAELSARADTMDAVLGEAYDVLDGAVVHAVGDAIDRVRERLALGVDRTVVAIVGGTGSGKSSLFNAVTGLDFADAGDTRPTTSAVTACVWGPDGGPLLDWLGVDRHRRIQRESMLDAGTQDYLAGLVLLDLPDHDSVATAHRQVVDAVLPAADLVVWVVDPQKYADDALHSGYLQDVQGRTSAVLVVLNQIDTVPTEYRDTLLADLNRLLVADGLQGSAVLPVSARTGYGIPALRSRLAEVAAGRSAAAEHAADDLDVAAGLLADALGPRLDAPGADDLDPVVETLTTAAGLDAVADAYATVLGSGGELPASFGTVHVDGARLARDQWLDRATAPLSPAWAAQVASRVATAEELGQATADALKGLTLGVRRSGLVRVGPWVAVLLGAGAVLALLSAFADGDWTVHGVLGGALLVAALLVWFGTRWWRRVDAARQASSVGARGRAVVHVAAMVRLVDPTADVYHRLARLHDQVAEVAAQP